MERFDLFRYLDEQSFRFNERHADDSAHFQKVVDGIIGRRLTYAELIGTAAKAPERL